MLREKKKVSNSFLKDKKRLAWTLYAILKNNVISGPFLYVLLFVENFELILMFLAFASQFKQNDLQSISSNIREVFTDINNFVNMMLENISFNIYFQTFFICFVICKNVYIYSSLVYIAYHNDSPEKAKKSNAIAKTLSFMFQFVSKVMFTPKMIFLFYFFRNTSLDTVSLILLYIGNFLAISASVFLEIVLTPIVNIRVNMPDELPWCTSKSFIPYFKSLFKLSQAVCLVIKIPNLAIVILLLIQGINLASEILLLPYHNKIVGSIKVYGSSVLFTLYLILSLELLIDFNYEITIVGFVLSFIIPIFFFQVKYYRMKTLRHKLFDFQLKNPSEIELAFTLYANILVKAHQNPEALKELNGILLIHKDQCSNINTCYCQTYDKALQANKALNMFQHNKFTKHKNRTSNTDRQNIIQNEEQKEYSQQQSNVDSQLSFNEKNNLTVKGVGSINTNHLLNRDIELIQEELRFYKQGIINPIFNGEFPYSQIRNDRINNKAGREVFQQLPDDIQYLLKPQDEDEESHWDFLNYQQIKHQTITHIIYEKVRYYSDYYPNNIRILMFKAYFELFAMRKKYLSHQTLTKMTSLKLGFINNTMFLIDQQFMIEYATKLYQNKDDQMLDIEKIIMNNSAFQDFYDFNKETSFLLNSFWSMLANQQNTDIETLYKSGEQTSDMIKKTKQKFKELLNLGIDKRNVSLYYLYANFNKYVLNSGDLYSEYIHKMEQIKSMNKTIKENYKDNIISDVDKSGFLVVNGTFENFGKILFANKKLCIILDYLPEQLIGKAINILMPQIISDKHHLFLDQFRETGQTRLIQKPQALFMKNQEGYILPCKVFIKFHYDKVYGHVFCAVINKTKQLYPFNNKKKHNFNEMMTIITDDHGVVSEISKSVTNFIGIPVSIVQQNQKFSQDNMKIYHIVDIDIAKLDSDINREIQTSIRPEFQCDSENGLVNSLVIMKSQKLNMEQDQYLMMKTMIDSPKIDIRVKMCKVNHNNILTLRYFFIELIASQDQADPNNIEIELQQDYKEPQIRIEKQDTKNDIQLFIDERSGSSTSSSNSRKLINEFIEKDIDQIIRNDSRTPKILKQIIVLVLLLLFSITVISASILGLYIKESSNSKQNIQNLGNSFENMIITSYVMNLLRSTINFNIGIENKALLSQNMIWKSKFQDQSFAYNDFIRTIIIEKLGEIQIKQKQIDNIDLRRLKSNQDLYERYKKLRDELQYSYITSNGQIEYQKQAYSVAMRLLLGNIQDLISRIEMLQNQTLSKSFIFTDYYSQFNIMTQNQSLEYQTLQQQMFFVFNNYIKYIDQDNEEYTKIYLRAGIDQSHEEETQRTLIMSIISIITILIIILAFSPITLKIRKSKYQVLLFFVELEPAIIQECQRKSQVFEDQFYTEKVSKLNFEQEELGKSHNILDNSSNQSAMIFNEEIDDAPLNHPQIKSRDYYYQTVDEGGQAFKVNDEITRKKQLMNDKTLKKLREENEKKLAKAATKFGISDFDMNESQDYVVPPSKESSGPSGEIVSQYNQDFLVPQINRTDIIRIGRNKSTNASTNDMRLSQFGQNRKKQKNAMIDNQKSQEFSYLNPNFKNLLPDIEEEQDGINDYQGKQPFYYYSQHDFRNLIKQAQNAKDSPKSFRKIDEEFQDDLSQSVQMNSFSEHIADFSHINLRQQSTQNDNNIKQSNQTMIQTTEDLNVKIIAAENVQGEVRIQDKIQNISTHQKSSLILSMMLLFLLFSSYFVGIYIFTDLSTSQFQKSFEDLNVFYQRDACMTKLFFLTREEFQQNITASKAQFNQKGFNTLSMNKLWDCIDLETNYTAIRKKPGNYLKDVQSIMNDLDSNRLCLLISQNTNYTEADCRSIQNNILSNGLSLYKQENTKSLLISQLDFFSRSGFQRNSTYILSKLRNSNFIDMLYSNMMFLYEVNMVINANVRDSIKNYIDLMNLVHFGLFAGLQVLSFGLALYFFVYVFKTMRKDMLSSHTMLAMLPKQLLEKQQQIKIKEFLIA
ncbi:pas domain s-box family protein [Stylonychia lemnae]|uniref:Pas domain s-box family protein n=1 Tax=Stylonychia lemnae TaxID=5949 RepID=A0A078ABM8_STYLE|nr:pas domain s-box family protein [Stylonychia lemnae]|eukprot:CDW79589.1 pas domain s-box family protein [Stylonychia lemnae]